MNEKHDVSYDSVIKDTSKRVSSIIDELTGCRPDIEHNFDSNKFLQDMLDRIDKIDAKFYSIKPGLYSRYKYKTYLVDMSDNVNALRMYCTYASLHDNSSNLKYCLILNIVIDYATRCIKSHKIPFRYVKTVECMLRNRFPSRITELFRDLC